MKRVVIGPVTSAPSWEWIGGGLIPELARYYEVTAVKDFEAVPDADVVLAIKQRPSAEACLRMQDQGMRIIYAPVDFYHSEEAIAADSSILGRFDLVLVHSEALAPYIAPHARRIALVEHHARDALAEPASYKAEGFVLWVGACENLPFLMQWWDAARPTYPLQILTNLGNVRSRLAAQVRARELGIGLKFDGNRVNGLDVHHWSVDLQRRMMESCRAAIDVKGATFNQLTKPPTKGQQFIVSGIPFACNADSGQFGYYARRGFALAEPGDTDRLFSLGYFEETRAFSKELRETTRLDRVAAEYRSLIESTFDAR